MPLQLEVFNDTCWMVTDLVVLQYSALTHGLQCWRDGGLQNVFFVANAG